MPPNPANPAQPRPDPLPLGVYRVEYGTKSTIWTIGRRVLGLWTHWLKGRSVYCTGEICHPTLHAIPRVWKCFVAAAVWTLPEGVWRPIVLEVTEALELDFRGLYERGQLWELSRAHRTPKRNPPVKGVLLNRNPDLEPPEPFSIMEVLQHLFHQERIELDAVNALPPRQLMEPVNGPPPRTAATTAGEHGMTPEEWEECRRKMGLPAKPPKDKGSEPPRK